MSGRSILSAIALLVIVGCQGNVDTSSDSSVGVSPTTITNVSSEGSGDLTIHVPKMHCPVACWPTVKKTLEAEAGVSEVQLAEQAEEGAIDNPRVILKLDGEFDADHAIAALSSAGFADSVVEP